MMKTMGRLFGAMLPLRHLAVMLLLGLAPALMPQAASAADCTLGNESQTCTYNQPFFDLKNNCADQVKGILASIVDEIYAAVNNASEKLFNAITGDDNFNLIVGACFTLFIIFFGVAFMFGFLQMTLKEGIFRLIKIGVIVWIISPDGWTAFNDIVVTFFNKGTIQLISAFITIAQPNAAINPDEPGSVFSILDATVNVIFSPRMLVTIIACLATAPYGLLVGGALCYAVFGFIQAMIKSLMVFSLSLVAKALLFGIAPIFFVFLLFDRTKTLFQGWVNQLVNFSLQPILMFAFLAFFSVMIESSANQILANKQTHVCWTKKDTQAGTPFDIHNWSFVCVENGVPKPFEGMHAWNGAIGCPGADNFPLSIVNILIFMLIVHLASMMIDIVTTLAGELSQGVTKLDQLGGGVSEWFTGRTSGGSLDSDNARAIMKKPGG